MTRLARLSLGAFSFFVLPGCLIDDPPSYTEPTRTPPRLAYQRAYPPLEQVIKASWPRVIDFTVPVASEDAGEGLRAQLWLDEGLEDYDSLPASTLDDTGRSISFSFAVPRRGITIGCHRFKIRVGHESTLPQGAGPPLDNDDVAEAYWLAFLNLPPDQDGVPLEDCAITDIVLGAQP